MTDQAQTETAPEEGMIDAPENFSDYEKARGEGMADDRPVQFQFETPKNPRVEPPKPVQEQQAEKKDEPPKGDAGEEKAKAKASDGDGESGKSPEKEDGISNAIKQRLAREKKKQEQLKAENDQLKAKLEGKGESEEKPEEETKSAEASAEEPQRSDYESDDDWWTDMVAYENGEDLPVNPRAKEKGEEETKGKDTKGETEAAEKLETEAPEDEEYPALLLSDIKEKLDGEERAREGLWAEFESRIENDRLTMTEDMLEEVILHPDGYKIIESLVDNPGMGRILSRRSEEDRQVALKQLLSDSGKPGDNSAHEDAIPALDKLAGDNKAPKGIDDVNSFEEYQEARAGLTRKRGGGFQWGAVN